MFIDQAPQHWTGPGLPDHLMDRLKACWHLGSRAPTSGDWTLYDNPDWALWRAGVLLLRSGQTFVWQCSGERQALRVRRKQVRFWWDLPDSPLQQMLRPLIGVRALLDQARVRWAEDEMLLCNSDRKIVARLYRQKFDLMQQYPAISGSCWHIKLQPLRGYDDEFKQIAGQLDSLLLPESWERQTAEEPIDRQLLRRAGLQPAQPKAKSFGLAPGEQTEPAVRRLALAHLQQAGDQHWGLVADLDTEFLHQYRVALRKTRSLLALMKAAFPETGRQEWKLGLTELARATNRVRDLDVFLLSEPNCRQLLPGDYREGLDQLFRQCRRQRQEAFRRLRSFMQSQAYARKFDELRDSFSEPPEFATELAARPIKPVVDAQILRRYRKICRRIARLDSDSPAEQLHQLRIAGKKLRYLMEFFAELYPEKPMAKNIKATKKLQSLLGDFNDYSVQIAFLRERLDRAESPALVAAVNGLIAVLYQQQLALRVNLAETLRAFCTEARHRKLEQMCRDTGGGV